MAGSNVAIIDFFDRGWRINPGGAAYVMGDTSYSFDQIGKLSCRIANGLLAGRIGRHQHGAVWSRNDPIAWACTLGLWRAGAAWIPVNPGSPPDENCALLDRLDCEVIFFQAEFAAVIEALRARLPKVKQWVCIDGSAGQSPSLADWSSQYDATRPDVEVGMDDTVVLMTTGGTTGLPKGVMNTHRSWQTFIAHFMISFPYQGEERPVNLAAAPMTHTAGGLSLPCTARGGTVIVLPKPDPVRLLDSIARHRVTEFFLPPTVIYRLLEVPGIEKRDFSSLRYFIYGAAPMSLEKLKRAIEVFGPVMAGGYGQTEAPASISFLPPSEHFVGGKLASDERLSSVGRPGPLIRVEILDDCNRPLSAGETGEICVKGDLVMKGYYKAADKTAETIVDGWLHTGDIGHLDDSGYLHITDRKKDMIISGGFNVYPSEVEQVIWSHQAVQDCAVIGVPDEQWGEAVKAVVELNPGQEVSGEELIALCKQKLGSIRAPKTIDFVPALPRSPAGKVLKKDLRAKFWKDVSRNI
jgi:acyl-CoA synthetase (AMP-forming)/AMP-acid ligase II